MPNHVKNILTFRGDQTSIDKLMSAIQSEELNEETGNPFAIDFNKIIPTPDNIFQGALGQEERLLYGKNNWYDWNIENWGTKWGAYDITSDGNTITFNTAWNAPKKVIKKLSQQYPQVKITHQWADEDLGHNVGEACYESGIARVLELEGGSKEAYELAAQIREFDLSEYGYVFSEESNTYIWVDTDEDVM